MVAAAGLVYKMGTGPTGGPWENPDGVKTIDTTATTTIAIHTYLIHRLMASSLIY